MHVLVAFPYATNYFLDNICLCRLVVSIIGLFMEPSDIKALRHMMVKLLSVESHSVFVHYISWVYRGYKSWADEYGWLLLVFRLFNIFLSSTWFVPDESFQSVEVAFKMVYGQGFLSWEWSSDTALRSAIHPTVYAVLFYVLKAMKLDFKIIINWAPNVLHAGLFAFADVCYLKFLRQLCRNKSTEIVKTTFLLYSTNWFLLYCSTRTLSNTIETALTIMALNWYEGAQVFQTNQDKKVEEELESHRSEVQWSYHCFYFLCAAFAVTVRPTAVIIWGPLYLVNFFESSHKFAYLIRCSIPCGAAAILISFIVDLLYYGFPALCLWNFAKFNLLQGGSAHFGANAWFWYFINGLPSVFTISCLPLFTLLIKKILIAPVSSATDLTVWGSSHPKEIPSRYFWTSLFYVAVHSLIAHKEHRFLLPIIPLLMPYLVVEMNELLDASAHFNMSLKVMATLKRIVNVGIVFFNVAMALYFGTVHQRGPHAAANFVFNQILELNPNTKVQVLQLMPCFSMPQYCSFHPHSVHIRMLDCTASLEGARRQHIGQLLIHGQVEDYREDGEQIYDEADQFHREPLGWIRDNWPLVKPSEDAISVVLAYEKTYKRIQSFLERKNYKVVSSIFHSHFLTSPNQDSRILVSVKTYGF